MKVQTTDNIAVFFLDDLPQATQRGISFTDPHVANEAGAPMVATLLILKDVAKIDIGPMQQPAQYDYMRVYLQDGLNWDEKPSPRSLKTRKELVEGVIQQRLYQERCLLITQQANQYYDPDFPKALQAKLNDMAEKGIIRVKEDNGAVKVVSYDPDTKSLVMQFSGACSTGCVDSRSGTENVITSHLCYTFPGAIARRNIKFTDVVPA